MALFADPPQRRRAAAAQSRLDRRQRREALAERHQIAAWGRLGVAAHQHLRKGSRLRVEGRLETRQWHEVEDSQPRYRTQVVAVNILFLDARDERAQPEGDIPDAHLAILEARQDIVEPPASVYEDTPALV